ncbi:YceH family protein [Noviherbaspirillum sp. CPCC 100848]|uniref:YceH family protein n=1 Tax=Noviherbaspirillum album TaxID=3080276 RepID=A0ABU6JCQ0_9BURK|nr:YceH family protein [Noviherbaspirillum sp. CPCC 100848]MEC4721414.1 YceH family protein [Noviherbaspirillum sp. CPCC 100848]
MLDAYEIRVLAVLAEKEALTPDNYPLSLNALTNGCNQLSSRDPVMSISEDTVQDVLQRLSQKRLVSEVRQAGGRVAKYEHRMRMKWSLEQDKLAVLTILMLRGIQTAGEIRVRTGRLHDFASVPDVETALQFLIDKYPPVVARLARAPGTKEARYAHLLSGEEVLARQESAASFSAQVETPRQDRISQLENEVAQLRSQVESLTAQFQEFRKQFD